MLTSHRTPFDNGGLGTFDRTAVSWFSMLEFAIFVLCFNGRLCADCSFATGAVLCRCLLL